MEKFVVTITRQFGSLGRPGAKRMSEILGIEYYDRDIVDQAAKKLKLPVSVINQEEEKAAKPEISPFSRMMFPLGKGTSSTQDSIFEAQKNIIEFLDKNPDSKFSKLAEKFCGVKYLKNRIRDPREFVDENKIAKFKNEIEKSK